LTWKVKNKATSQLARSDARIASMQWRIIIQVGQRETVLPKGLIWGTVVLTVPKVQASEGE